MLQHMITNYHIYNFKGVLVINTDFLIFLSHVIYWEALNEILLSI